MARSQRPTLALGDAVRVYAALRPKDAEAQAAIDELLGLERSVVMASPPSLRDWAPNESPPAAAPPKPVLPDLSPVIAQSAPLPAVTAGGRTSVRRTGRVAFEPPAWAGETKTPLRPAEGDAASAPPPPLFARTQARAILGATLATAREGTELDLDAAMAQLMARQPLKRLPRKTDLTLSRGAELLIDQSTTLDPLRDDIRAIVEELERLFDPAGLTVLKFSGCPLGPNRRVWSDTQAARPFVPRGQGTPVLVVSDFTIAAPSSSENVVFLAEWLAFAAMMRSAGSRPLGLVPYAPSRWPAALADAMHLVHLSERTTARQVARAFRGVQRPRRPG